MRILVACPTLGINSEVWILRQIDGLVNLGHDLSVLCWQTEGYTPQDHTDQHVSVLPHPLKERAGLLRWKDRASKLPSRNFLRGSAKEERQLHDLLVKQRPDVILCHFGYVALRVLPVARKLGIPVVAHFHGLDLSAMLSGRWYRWSLKKQVQRFDQDIVVGSHQAKLLDSYGLGEDKVNLIPCGVPTDLFNPVQRPNREDVRFIQVSRIVPWKGIEEGIRAFAHVNQVLPNTRLVLVGDGLQFDQIKQLVGDLNLHQVIEFTGPLPPEEVVRKLQDSDIFIHHSLTYHTGWCEGFGVSIAEAAAMSLPLVVSRSGGIPDQVVDSQTGFMVEERNVQAMADAMLKLAESAELRMQMGQAGRQRMIDHFDTSRQIKKLEQVLLKAFESQSA